MSNSGWSRSARAGTASAVHIYSDSHNDLPLSSKVSAPVAVDPTTRCAHAGRAGWQVAQLRHGNVPTFAPEPDDRQPANDPQVHHPRLKALGRKKPLSHEPALIAHQQHGIRREHIHSSARRVCRNPCRRRATRPSWSAGRPRPAHRRRPEGLRHRHRRDAGAGTRGLPPRPHHRSPLPDRIHVMIGAETLEVTTFRGELAHDTKKDAHGRVLHDNVFGSQAEDAARRDFTVNASTTTRPAKPSSTTTTGSPISNRRPCA